LSVTPKKTPLGGEIARVYKELFEEITKREEGKKGKSLWGKDCLQNLEGRDIKEKRSSQDNKRRNQHPREASYKSSRREGKGPMKKTHLPQKQRKGDSEYCRS